MNDAPRPTLTLASQLLEVADALDAQYMLARALSEPNADPQQRAQVADALLGKAISPEALEVVRQVAMSAWPSAGEFAAGVRDTGIDVGWQVAIADGSVDAVREELLELSDAITDDPALATAVADPSRELTDRAQLIDSLTGGGRLVTHLLARCALSDTRGPFLANVSAYLDALAARRGHRRARVVSAVPLTPGQQAELLAELSRIFASPIDLEPVVDPGIVGGVRVESGGDVIDGSIKARLDAVRSRMAGEEGNHV